MPSLFTIAWRNMWRTPSRATMLVTAVALGMLGFVGATLFIDGIAHAVITAAISQNGGHIQIARTGYHTTPALRHSIAAPAAVETLLVHQAAYFPDFQASPKVTASGMMDHAGQAAGVTILGVDPAREAALSALPTQVVAGHPLDPDGAADEIVVGQALATRLKADLGDTVVLTVSDRRNQLTSGAYRIVGIYETSNAAYDGHHALLKLGTAQQLLAMGRHLSTFTVHFTDLDLVPVVTDSLRAGLEGEGLEVLPWQERSPLLSATLERYDYAIFIVVVLLFLAIALTIANAYQVVVLERVQEFGILMAGGVGPRQVRLMVFLEAFFTAAVGMVAGLLVAGGLVLFWMQTGLTLGTFAQGLGPLSVDAVLYPRIVPEHLLSGFAVILVMVTLAAYYPARLAGRFDVVDALNHA